MDGRQTRRWLHNRAGSRSTTSPPGCRHLNHQNSPSIKRETANTDESVICPAAKCRGREDTSPIPWRADASDQGWGGSQRWERPRGIAQTQTAVHRQLHAACPATQKGDQTHPALKLSFQRVKSLSLLSFFKLHLPPRIQVRHCSLLPVSARATNYNQSRLS